MAILRIIIILISLLPLAPCYSELTDSDRRDFGHTEESFKQASHSGQQDNINSMSLGLDHSSVLYSQVKPLQLAFSFSKPNWFSKMHSFNLPRSSRETQAQHQPTQTVTLQHPVVNPTPAIMKTSLSSTTWRSTSFSSIMKPSSSVGTTSIQTTSLTPRYSTSSTPTLLPAIYRKNNPIRMCPSGQAVDFNGNCRPIIRFK